MMRRVRPCLLWEVRPRRRLGRRLGPHEACRDCVCVCVCERERERERERESNLEINLALLSG
jgi:hypothetical protein